MSIYKLPAGTVLDLSPSDLNICKTSIALYDPHMADIEKAIKSEGDYLLEVHLNDGAIWKIQEHPMGLIPFLSKLGSTHDGKMLTANLASVYIPDPAKKTKDPGQLIMPGVDCGEGYRQLDFGEKILETDEYYQGPRGGWKKTSEAGNAYIPTHSNHEHAQYALFRRKLPEPTKTPKI